MQSQKLQDGLLYFRIKEVGEIPIKSKHILCRLTGNAMYVQQNGAKEMISCNLENENSNIQ